MKCPSRRGSTESFSLFAFLYKFAPEPLLCKFHAYSRTLHFGYVVVEHAQELRIVLERESSDWLHCFLHGHQVNAVKCRKADKTLEYGDVFLQPDQIDGLSNVVELVSCPKDLFGSLSAAYTAAISEARFVQIINLLLYLEMEITKHVYT